MPHKKEANLSWKVHPTAPTRETQASVFSFPCCLLLSLRAAGVPELQDTVLAPSLVPRQEQSLLPLARAGTQPL